MTYAPNPEPGAAETQALNTATDIMAILHDAVLNPGPGGLVQVKAKIQVAVRDAIKSMVPAGTAEADRDTMRRKNEELADKCQRLEAENTQLQGKLHDLQHDLQQLSKSLEDDLARARSRNGALAREASNYRQEAAANAQRRDEARAELDALSCKNEEITAELESCLGHYKTACVERNDAVSMLTAVQDALGIVRHGSTEPMIDLSIIIDAIDYAKRRISAEHQKALCNLVEQWMPPAGVRVFNVWLTNQPREA